MKTVAFESIVAAVRDLCIRAAYELPADVLDEIKSSLSGEPSPQGRTVLEQIVRNAEIAPVEKRPLCQDTGTAVFFISMGLDVTVSGGTIDEAINEGCRQGYRDGYLRKSIVGDPLFDRKNTGDNTPAVVHLECVGGDAITITLLPKGGGCENMSALEMLKPSDGPEGVVEFVVETVRQAGGNPCPPVIVGVGIGGTADKASLLAKKALLRKIGTRHADERYRDLEELILRGINSTGNGPQGLGGVTTALAVHIESFPCHIASLPVAVNLNCHSARQASVTL